MGKVAIIYWSGTGNTEAMANEVYNAAKEAGAEAELMSVGDISAEVASEYNTLLLGCPAMGAEVLEEEEFEPFFSELEGSLAGKKVGLFGSYGWGDGEWMRSWQERTEATGAVFIGSVIANDAPDDDALSQCAELGKRSALE